MFLFIVDKYFQQYFTLSCTRFTLKCVHNPCNDQIIYSLFFLLFYEINLYANLKKAMYANISGMHKPNFKEAYQARKILWNIANNSKYDFISIVIAIMISLLRWNGIFHGRVLISAKNLTLNQVLRSCLVCQCMSCFVRQGIICHWINVMLCYVRFRNYRCVDILCVIIICVIHMSTTNCKCLYTKDSWIGTCIFIVLELMNE